MAVFLLSLISINIVHKSLKMFVRRVTVSEKFEITSCTYYMYIIAIEYIILISMRHMFLLN
jgi:hypothetical protein